MPVCTFSCGKSCFSSFTITAGPVLEPILPPCLTIAIERRIRKHSSSSYDTQIASQLLSRHRLHQQRFDPPQLLTYSFPVKYLIHLPLRNWSLPPYCVFNRSFSRIAVASEAILIAVAGQSASSHISFLLPELALNNASMTQSLLQATRRTLIQFFGQGAQPIDSLRYYFSFLIKLPVV